MCGIFGIVTPKPKKLDLETFCVLGVNNDSRGGDSCGIFIDKKYEYGVNELKLFYNFFPTSKLLASTDKCSVALGHCRKASVGAINEANAQPIVIKDNNGEVQFVLIHNGTIINYKELAAKYIPDINIVNMTDSQVMAHIFYHKGYNVLGEYLGAGAFVMVDYRKGDPDVLLFKGESRVSIYNCVTQVERPLFCSYNNTEFIFSSIMDYLKALRPNREVLTVPTNTLLRIKSGKLLVVQKYDRSKLWITDNSPKTTKVSNICKWGSDTLFQKYSWDDIVDMDTHGVYMIGNFRAHGIYYLDAIGNIETGRIAGTIQAAFWDGVLLKNANCFDFLNKFTQELGATKDELIDLLPDLVHFLSPCACWMNKYGQWVTSDTPSSNFLYTGTAIFPFTNEEISFSGGRLDTYTEGIPYKDALLDLLASSDYKVDSDVIKDLL